MSALDFEPLEGVPASLPLGQSGRRTYRLTARRKADQGRCLPERLACTSPLLVAIRGEPSTKTDAAGLIEATREIVVTIPAERRAGPRSGQIVFGWADGQTETRPLNWEVRPRLTILPSGLVLRRSSQPIERKIIVVSDERPFQVKEVSSHLLAARVELPEQERLRHVIVLRLDVSRAPAGQAVNIDIQTDHPDQPTVSLSVLVLPEAKGTES